MKKWLVLFVISIITIFKGANAMFANYYVVDSSFVYGVRFVIVGILGLILSILLIIGKRKKFLLIFFVISILTIFAGAWLFAYSFNLHSVPINGRLDTGSVFFYISMMLVGGGILSFILSFLLIIGKAIVNMLGTPKDR